MTMVLSPHRFGPSIYELMGQGTVYIAHRGYALRYPEHTAEAFAAAIADGAKAIEPDVQLLSDDGLAVIHDTTVNFASTSTGNVAALDTAGFEALTLDAGTWFGGGFGNLSPVTLPDLLSAHAGTVVFFPEAAYPPGGNTTDLGDAIVAALQAANIPSSQVVVQSYDLTPLGPVVAAGYLAAINDDPALAPEDIATAAAAGVTFAVLSLGLSDSRIGDWLAADFYVFAYTANRRRDRDRLIGLGVHGMFTDDGEYLQADTPFATADSFASGEWQPGMIAYNQPIGVTAASLAAEARGRFSDTDAWGYAGTNHLYYRGCLQGWACPVASDPDNAEWLLDLKVTFGTVDNADQTRWASVAIANSDQAFADGVGDGGWTEGPDVYHFLMRKNGTLQIYRVSGISAAVLLAENTGGSAISDGTTVRFKIEINEAKLQLRRLDGGGATVQAVTSYDVSAGYRGGYFHLGHNRVPALFRDISIGSSTPYGLWTPAQKSPVLWFSASDSEYTGGTWRDISGNTDHFIQASGTAQPTYSATGINSLPSLNFDGSSDTLDGPAGSLGAFKNVGQAWVLAVYRHTTDGGNTERPVFIATINGGTGSRVYLQVGSSGTSGANKPQIGGRRLDADSFGGSGLATALTNGQETILLGYLDFTNRTATLYQDGVQVAQGTGLWSGGGNTSNTDSTGIRIGSNDVPNTWLNGRAGEVVTGVTALDSDDIDYLFGWAAWKYGLASVLPALHPYKASPPTV